MKQGFTLVELSMVLVIIGLVSGVVLVGKDMIAAAQIRGTISQIEHYDTAINLFKGRYYCKPGDCRIAANFGFNAGANQNGNGDGIIQADTVSYRWEAMEFWYQLSASGLVGGEFKGLTNESVVPEYVPQTAVDYPAAKAGKGGVWVSVPLLVFLGAGNSVNGSVENYNSFWITAVTASAGGGNATFDGALTPEQSFIIDTKVDDGWPLSGKVIVSSPSTTQLIQFNYADAATGIYGDRIATPDRCAFNDVTPPIYNTLDTGQPDRCILQFIKGF